MQDLIANLGREGEPCERVLGSTNRVKTVAGFYERNFGLIQLMTLNATKDFTENNSFNREEMDAFKSGVGAIGMFMSECLKERNRLQKEKKEL